MKKRRRQSGQALIEYGFLMVLLATITFAVIALAGSQLQGAFQDVSYEFTHITDTTTLAPDGSTLGPGVPPTASCPSGESLQLRSHKWKCQQTGQH